MRINQIGGAFGVRLLETALVVHFDSMAMVGKRTHCLSCLGSLWNSEMTTKAVSSNRTPKAVAISIG
jgi:hypothetical protein